MRFHTFCILLIVLSNSILISSSRNRNRISRTGILGDQHPRWTWKEVSDRKCGYEGCPTPKRSMLNVHIVAHTHDDVGWLKTVDQYFYGSKSTIQKAGVQYIIDSVVQELLSDPTKRFIYVESAFFFKWWDKQDDSLKAKVRMLVDEGRLEFIGGAWSMNDEATTHYHSTIDQFTWGLRQLNDTFGECGRPRVGWQIDPFGHSREMASMFAQMGYDGLFFGRLDYQDKKTRLENKTAEFVWHGSQNLGEKSDLFTGALYNNYSPPPGFCFDILCSDDPIIDDKSSADYNVEEKVDGILEYARNMSRNYTTNNVLITMGEDFNFQDANMWFTNLDKLILYANERQLSGSNINLFYSTPSCYLKSLHDSDIKWTSKDDDFFPYSSDPNAFWTGYFTSRPTLKRFERVGSEFLQICKQLEVIDRDSNVESETRLTELREAMGIMQHHDAVTGTEKQQVAQDYARILTKAMKSCGLNMKRVLNKLSGAEEILEPQDSLEKVYYSNPVLHDKYEFQFESCLNLNISKCLITEQSEKFVVTLYNPLAHSTFQYVRLPVSDDTHKVTDYRGVDVPSQIISIPDSINNLPYRFSNSSNELVFLATELPPLGYKSYFVERIKNVEAPKVMYMHQNDSPTIDDQITIGNKYLNLTFGQNGLLYEICVNGVSNKLVQNFLYYESASGDNAEYINRSSGAYIFRPNNTEKFVATRADIQIFTGDLVDEVHQTFTDWISQVIRVYKDENYVEFEWLVGPIPIEDGIGKEVISRYYTDIASNGQFYTDSNGREMLRRIRNRRDTWHLNVFEPIAGNYYPVTTKIAIEDNVNRLAILNDRSQGGSSLFDGSIELMIHRRILHDDAFGVSEALNETAFGRGLIARGKHYLMFGQVKKTEEPSIIAKERFLQNRKFLPSWIFVSNVTKYNLKDWQDKYANIHSSMSLSLPQNINLMTFEPWKDGSILIRFEHLLEKDEDDEYSKPVTFNLQDIFHTFDITGIRETTLAGNQWLSDMKRLKFKEETSKMEDMQITINLDLAKDETDRQTRKQFSDPFIITLNPMEIRTFIIELE